MNSTWIESLSVGANEIVFTTKQGRTYSVDVPPSQVDQLGSDWMGAASKGKFFNSRVAGKFTINEV